MLNGWELSDGQWIGPHGERLAAISGGQFEGVGDWLGFSTELPTPQWTYTPPVEAPLSLGTSTALDTMGVSTQLPSVAWPQTGTPPPDTGGASWLDRLSGYADKLLPFVKAGTGLGATAASIQAIRQAGQQTDILKSAEKRAAQAAAPAAAAGSALIPAGTQALLGGPLPPELEAEVTSWTAQAKAKARQTFAHLGITDSTMADQMDAWIDLQGQELRASLAGGLETAGITAAGTAISGAQAGGQLAAGQTTQITSAITAANQALNQMLGATG